MKKKSGKTAKKHLKRMIKKTSNKAKKAKKI